MGKARGEPSIGPTAPESLRSPGGRRHMDTTTELKGLPRSSGTNSAMVKSPSQDNSQSVVAHRSKQNLSSKFGQGDVSYDPKSSLSVLNISQSNLSKPTKETPTETGRETITLTPLKRHDPLATEVQQPAEHRIQSSPPGDGHPKEETREQSGGAALPQRGGFQQGGEPPSGGGPSDGTGRANKAGRKYRLSRGPVQVCTY